MPIIPEQSSDTHVYFQAEESLGLYIRFHFLPVRQQGLILFAIAGVNSAVLDTIEMSYKPTLNIDEVRTGESIDLKFRQGIWLPRLEYTKEEDLNVVVPRWGAALILSGSLLLGGVEAVDRLKLVRVFEGTPPAVSKQLKELLRQDVLDQLSNAKDREGYDLRQHLQDFHHEINQPNIRGAEINGLAVRRRSEDEGQGQAKAEVELV